jgi:hypothetical protein
MTVSIRWAARVGVLAFSVVGLFVACSSTPSKADYCGKLKERYDACPNTGSGSSTTTVGPDGGTTTTTTREPFNQVRCENEHTCLETVFEGAITSAYLDCASTKDCTVSTSKCDEQAFAAGTHATEADQCAKKYVECKSGKSSFSDDYCVNVRGMSSDALAKVMPCFDRPCEQVRDCYKATLNAFAPTCDL